MTRRTMTALMCLAATWALAGGALAAPVARWHLDDWPWRVPVTVPSGPATGLAGDDVAVVTFLATWPVANDGVGVRVGVEGGALVPARVLQVGPGEQLRVAFALRPGVRRYYVYFGNRQAGAAEAPLQLKIRRGVLMETYRNPGGALNTYKQAKRVFEKAQRRLGCDFRQRIFIGHNPFGPQNSVCSRFTGYLKVPRSDTYRLIISSRDASFLSIDDKLVISNGGRHRPQRDFSKSATVTLAAGLHKVEMLHVNRTPAPIVVLAWLRDGQRRALPIPPIAFAPVVQATAGPIAQRSGVVMADFSFRNAGWAKAGAQDLIRAVFRERLTDSGVTATEFRWEFDDGQTATGAEVEHVYLTPGVHRVKLTAQTPQGPLRRVHRISISRDWDKPRQAAEEPAVHGRIVREYDFQKLPDKPMVVAATLFAARRDDLLVLEVADIVAARDRCEPYAQREVLRLAIDIHRRQRRGPQAAKLLNVAIANARNPIAVATLKTLLGEVTMIDLDDPAGAQVLFEQVATGSVAAAVPGVARGAHIGLGDVHRRKGDLEAARAAYLKAMPVYPRPAETSMRRGSLGQNVAAALRQSDYTMAAQTLRQWELQLPVDRLAGQTTLLWARLHAAQNEWARIVVKVEALIKVNPHSRYAPQLLLHAAEAYLKLGQPATARRRLQTIVDDYGESALAVEARQRLGTARGR